MLPKGKVIYEEKHKWTLITTFIIVTVVVVMAVLLKLQYDRQNSSRVNEKFKLIIKM